MFKIATACIFFATSLSPFNTLFAADNEAVLLEEAPFPEKTSIPSEPAVEPRIRSKFFSAEAVEAIPKLKALNAKNPGFNKILFKLDGYPKHKEILFEIKRPLGDKPDEYHQAASFIIQDDGNYLTSDKQTLPYIVGSSRGFLPGERIIFRFRTADGTVNKEISGIPSPAIFKDSKGNIAMRAEILSEQPTVYTIDLLELNDGDEYELKSTSIGENVKAKGKYNSAKPLHFSPTPGSSRSKGGVSKLVIIPKTGESKGEVYILELPWGTALQAYQLGAKAYPYHN